MYMMIAFGVFVLAIGALLKMGFADKRKYRDSVDKRRGDSSQQELFDPHKAA
jgi:hypothetical protein